VTGTYTETLCPGGSTTVEGVLYDASNNGATFVSATPSIHGCDSTVTVNLTFQDPVTGTYTELLCAGGSTEVEGVTYDASNNGTSFISATPAANGCDSTVTVQLSFKPQETLDLIGIEGGCGTDTYTLIFDNSSSETLLLLLTNVSELFYFLPPGETRLEVEATGGDITLVQAGEDSGSPNCALLVSGTVSLPDLPTLTIDGINADTSLQISCNGANDGELTAVLAGEGSDEYTFRWSNDASGATISNVGPGTYTVTATNPDGCTITQSFTITEPTAIEATISTNPEDCIGNLPSVQVDTIMGGSGPYAISLDNSVFIPIDTFPFRQSRSPGAVQVSIQDVNGCTFNTEVQLVPALEGLVNISPEEGLVALGDSLLLNAQTNLIPDQIFWSPRSDSSEQTLSYFVSPTENTLYTLTIVDENGCSGSGQVLVRVDRRVPVYVPTAFSPNGDGNNDEFAIFANRGVRVFQNLIIYNRWGESVYQANGDLAPNDSRWFWDGTHRGEPLNPGVFVYSITAVLEDGRTELLTGEITLIR
ncbi:MAG: gliding motility-associated C-terminal domain-containing protein, partial [Bacteroidota bacterium]